MFPTLLAAVAAPAAKSAADSLAQPDPRLAVALVALLVAGMLWQMVSFWLASLVLAPEKSEFSNAAKLWCVSLFAVLGVAVVVGCGVAAAQWMDSRSIAIGALIVGGIMFIYIAFRLPMETYGMGLLRTFVFLLLVGVIAGVGQFAGGIVIATMAKGTTLAVANRTLLGRNPGDQDELRALLRERIPATASYLDSDDAATAADRNKPAPGRKAALRRIARLLEARRVALNPKNKPAVEAYQRDVKQYRDLYTELNPPPPKP